MTETEQIEVQQQIQVNAGNKCNAVANVLNGKSFVTRFLDLLCYRMIKAACPIKYHIFNFEFSPFPLSCTMDYTNHISYPVKSVQKLTED